MSVHPDLYRPKRRPSARTKRRRIEARLRGADAQARTHFMFSHGHCLDGTGSVVIAKRVFGDGVGVFYLQPSHVLHRLKDMLEIPSRDRTLLIADLSINPDDFDEIVETCATLASNGWTIEWLDHHHKQWEGLDLDRLRKHVAYLEVNDDATESGASLMQKQYAPKDAFAKKFANTVKDRDLWWNKTPDSETLEFAITWMGEDEFCDHFVAKTGRQKVVDDIVLDAAEKQRALVEEQAGILLQEVWEMEAPSGDKVGVVYGWLPKNVGLHRVLEREGVKVAINVRPSGTMSLRSAQDWPVCQIVAKQFNGGGHVNASGAKLPMNRLQSWIYVMRKGRTAQVEAVAKAAVEAIAEHAE